jgi:hypothetical protein
MVANSGGGVPSSVTTRPLTRMGCGRLAAAGVLVWLGEVVDGRLAGVRPVEAPVPPVVPPDVPPVPVLGGAVVPPLPWPVTADGISKLTAAAVTAITQFFEAIPPP